jgi:hypothetical protein
MTATKDARDKLILQLTQALVEFLDEMKKDPAWFEIGHGAAQAAYKANEARHAGLSHCYKNGMTLERV